MWASFEAGQWLGNPPTLPPDWLGYFLSEPFLSGQEPATRYLSQKDQRYVNYKMWQSLWPGCYLPLVWRQVDVNPLPFRVYVEIDKRKLVPVESVVHLQFRIRMKMIEMGQKQPD